MSVSARASTWLFSVERQAFRAEKWICIVSLVAMLVGICFSVAVRYLNLHLPDAGEIAIFAMAPLTFVGAAMCTYTGTHIAVDVIQQVKLPWVRRTGRVVTALAMIVFGAVYYWTALDFFHTSLSSGERGLDLGIPIAIPTFFFPLGMALVVLHSVAEMIRAATNEPSVGEEQP
ncbi:TRAP-type C4-dicarboxylate transport system permease small subunit [Hydrogenophaga palleronii]|uniref:TRAP transporter small permease protein n=1 Tax=Hydrogenophaga palleronii TaxID=65655 RepID=A0ABU1WMH6_9BURK|nr:TRAP transporter small permease subunit [Hydrogenophaga palleronii]MDR7150495.1 TRAP-type C4-dicarboxylate transport system permease small subunit [Hydrogenophaga palleronii]